MTLLGQWVQTLNVSALSAWQRGRLLGWQLTGACRARHQAKPAPQEPLLLIHVVVDTGQEPLVFVVKALTEGLSSLADLSLEDRSLSEETAEVGGLLRRHSHFLLDE